MKNPRNIVITGASSGLGEALAKRYANPGITLYLHGRNAERLAEVAHDCAARGADVRTQIGDVADVSAMEKWLKDADEKTPVDLVIANAGIGAGSGENGETPEQVRKVFDINIGGVINTVSPLIPNMIARRRGQIAIMSSFTALRGFPSAPAYSASKACVRAYGEGLRGALLPCGVEVSVICPGFVKTRMTDVNNFPMPFLMEANHAAKIIVRGLEKNKSRIAFPRRLYLPMVLVSILPVALTDPLFARLPAKPSL